MSSSLEVERYNETLFALWNVSDSMTLSWTSLDSLALSSRESLAMRSRISLRSSCFAALLIVEQERKGKGNGLLLI